MINLKEEFEKHEDEYLKFERIESPLHTRHDVAAFLLLDKLVPGSRGMIAAAEHDEMFLETDMEELAKVATTDDICTLVRCGVRFGDYDSLCMFV